MRTTGVFTTHSFQINFDKYGEPIYLIPFGDVHKSSPMHHAEKWQSFLEWAKTKPRAYFLGMGDYNDLGSTSERLILNNPHLHDSSVKTLEQLYESQTKKFVKDIDFMKGRLIGILGGNHYGVHQSGITTDQKIAEYMGTKFLGVSSLIRLQFCNTAGHAKRMTLDVFLHHGRGGGRTVGGSMNPVQQMANSAEADIYLMGDNHQKGIDFISRLKLTAGGGNLRLSQRKVLLGRTGSFLKGYEPNEQSYVVDAQMSPSDLGVIKIELTPRRESKEHIETEHIDIHASI